MHHAVIVINQILEFFESIGHIFCGKIWTIRVGLPLTNFDGYNLITNKDISLLCKFDQCMNCLTLKEQIKKRYE
jgi:hypothetical protein